MKLTDGMLLYHGSYAEIDQIDLNRGSSGRDFGKGFYLTSDFEQAKSFLRSSVRKAEEKGLLPDHQKYGYVTVFRYCGKENDLSVYEFASADKEWLWYISSNRREKLAEILKKNLKEELYRADILIGKVANDNTNRVLAAYLNGLFGDIVSEEAVNIAISQLIPEKLTDQVFFRTEKAIAGLQKAEVYRYDI